MTEREVIQRLNDMQPGDDSEIEHANADGILLEFLKTHRYKKIAEAYENARERVTFYYS